MPRGFVGRWRIVRIDNWPDDVVDLGEAHIVFTGGNDGEIAFVAVKGFLDVRYGLREGSQTAEFTFESFDGGDTVSGRGWASLGIAGRPQRRGFKLRLRADVTSSTSC